MVIYFFSLSIAKKNINIAIILTIICLIVEVIIELKKSMDSLSNCLFNWFLFNSTAIVLAFFIGKKFFNGNLIILNFVIYGLYLMFFLAITSFIDTGIVIKVNGIYTAIFVILEKIISLKYFKNIFGIKGVVEEIVTIFFTIMTIIFLIVTI